MADIEIIKGADNGNPPDTLRQMYPKVNRNFQKLNNEVAANKTDADNKLEAHKSSTTAHSAQNITYSGNAVGSNVKSAIDNMDVRIDNLILESGNSDPEVVDSRGGYPVLGDRLNAFDNRFNNIAVDVKIRGAKGDGFTNDTQIINEIITEISSAGGGVVYFPRGTYLTSRIILGSNVVLVGQGKVSVIKRIDDPDQTHFVTGESIENFEISNLFIDVDKDSPHTFPYTDGIHLNSCGKFLIDNCNVINAVNRGIHIEKNIDNDGKSVVKNCGVTGSGSACILLKNCTNVEVDNNKFKESADNGIVIQYTSERYEDSHLTISNNDVVNNGQIGIWCYADEPDRHTRIARILISDNEVINNGYDGIVTEINETIIEENIVDNNGSLKLSAAGVMVNTTNVTINGGLIRRSSGPGLDLGDCYNIIAQGIRIEENGTMGIEVNSSEDVIIDTCIVKNNNTSDVAVPFGANIGIYVYQGTDGSSSGFPGKSKNVLVKNCIVRKKVGSHQAYGIRVGETAENVMVIGCDVYDSGNTADFKIESPTCMLENNVSRGNGYNGNTINAASILIIPPDGDIFFIDGSGSITNIFTENNVIPKGRKITLILNTANITLKAGDGSSGNILNNNNADVSGFLKIVEYICLGGQFPLWLQLTASSGR